MFIFVLCIITSTLYVFLSCQSIHNSHHFVIVHTQYDRHILHSILYSFHAIIRHLPNMDLYSTTTKTWIQNPNIEFSWQSTILTSTSNSPNKECAKKAYSTFDLIRKKWTLMITHNNLGNPTTILKNRRILQDITISNHHKTLTM